MKFGIKTGLFAMLAVVFFGLGAPRGLADQMLNLNLEPSALCGNPGGFGFGKYSAGGSWTTLQWSSASTYGNHSWDLGIYDSNGVLRIAAAAVEPFVLINSLQPGNYLAVVRTRCWLTPDHSVGLPVYFGQSVSEARVSLQVIRQNRKIEILGVTYH